MKLIRKIDAIGNSFGASDINNRFCYFVFFQAKIQKHQAFEAEVAAHSNAIVVLDNTGMEMIKHGHFASETIKQRLDELHRLWDLLLSKLADKGLKLQQALVLVQFLRHWDEVMFWISDKESFVTTSDDFGHDLEHVELLQRKFDEFQKDMASQEIRVQQVNEQADKLITDSHPEHDLIASKKSDLNAAWSKLKELALKRQERLFGAHEMQRFNRDADETIAWISEKALKVLKASRLFETVTLLMGLVLKIGVP